MIAPLKTTLLSPTTEVVLLPETSSLPAASEPELGIPQTSAGTKAHDDRSLARSARLWQPCPQGEEENLTNNDASEHPLILLPRVFLNHSFGETLGDLISRGLEHFFCKETLMAETPRLLPEEPMVLFKILHADEDTDMPCTVLRDPAGEIGVLCESKKDPK